VCVMREGVWTVDSESGLSRLPTPGPTGGSRISRERADQSGLRVTGGLGP
jgi:hypothetical protein